MWFSALSQQMQHLQSSFGVMAKWLCPHVSHSTQGSILGRNSSQYHSLYHSSVPGLSCAFLDLLYACTARVSLGLVLVYIRYNYSLYFSSFLLFRILLKFSGLQKPLSHILSIFSPYAVLAFHMTRSIFRQNCKKKERKPE
jgi:hypothetical protein